MERRTDVSVIILVYNHEMYLEQALDSVRWGKLLNRFAAAVRMGVDLAAFSAVFEAWKEASAFRMSAAVRMFCLCQFLRIRSVYSKLG